MDNNTLENPKNTENMPTREWFAKLPDERRNAALRGTGSWKLANDPKKHETHLAPHRIECAQSPAYLDRASTPIREMLEAVPIELHDALVTVASATLEAQLFRLMKALRQICPAEYKAQAEQKSLTKVYVDAHFLSNEDERQTLWNVAVGKGLSAGKIHELRLIWKQVVRSEYLVSRLTVHIRSDY